MQYKAKVRELLTHFKSFHIISISLRFSSITLKILFFCFQAGHALMQWCKPKSCCFLYHTIFTPDGGCYVFFQNSSLFVRTGKWDPIHVTTTPCVQLMVLIMRRKGWVGNRKSHSWMAKSPLNGAWRKNPPKISYKAGQSPTQGMSQDLSVYYFGNSSIQCQWHAAVS